MSVPDARRLKELEAENARLKRMLAESLLGMEALKAALGRKH
jgi:putative transposase